eukprot:2197530-Alexandrium_andersonii.AAC.1
MSVGAAAEGGRRGAQSRTASDAGPSVARRAMGWAGPSSFPGVGGAPSAREAGATSAPGAAWP